ncbi:hypothetical protein DOTSEDRAFT_75953 [Dothistroma septosporum NZE10]|uniref:Uncharacterized protein n=1 Tax=Dothistroma septosporum (strain NZE10 / CBS 128990) TaxID=675120 RepID=M2WHG4_DOTSN|nr:hypothetical protein DOTSEDRAFT_75953 [Dothistroma septosporum NZE10]
MATETLTAPAPVANPLRRYSTDPAGTQSYATLNPNRRRTNSINIGSVARQTKRTLPLPSVPEDGQLKADAIRRKTNRESRLSRVFSWSTNWNFAGESTRRTTTFTGDQATLGDDRRFSKLNRRLSSISSYASNVADFLATTEPSHETNFPKGLTFPTSGGFELCVSVYGTVDALEATTMRLMMPMGCKTADFTGSKDYIMALEHICKLKNGDMLCRPTPEIERQYPGAAVILRGTVQDMVFKCYVVGTFPMALITGDTLPGTFEMEAVIF